MDSKRIGTLFAAASGLLFGVGLSLAGMTDPSKVQGFLDFTGSWDPSLALVMLGALVVYAVSYRLVRRRHAPLFAERFAMPTRRDIDAPLVVGAAIFGVGWGLGGICPGPALVDLGSGLLPAALFVGAMGIGMALQPIVTSRLASLRAAAGRAPRSEDHP